MGTFGIGLIGLAVLVVACSSNDEPQKKKLVDAGGGSSGWISAVGEEGTFARTFDEVSWDVQTLTTEDLYSVTCVGNIDGWAAGESGTVVRTADGGKTWKPEDAHTTANLRTIHFAYDLHLDGLSNGPPLVGIVAGDGGTLAISKNGGELWENVSVPSASTLRSAKIALNADLFVVVGDSGTLLRSTDLGKTWEAIAIDGAGDLTGVALTPNASTIVAVDNNGAVWASTDLAKSFHLEKKVGVALNDVAIGTDGLQAVAVGVSGMLDRSGCGGDWKEGPSGTAVSLHAALVTPKGVPNYVSGDDGTLIRGAGDGWSRVHSLHPGKPVQPREFRRGVIHCGAIIAGSPMPCAAAFTS